MSTIGLDIGTTGCKAIAFDEGGAILASAAREYGIETPRPTWAEQDAEAVWRLACEVLREVATSTSHDLTKALAISAQGEAIIPVDENGAPLRHAILGMDTRTDPENEWLCENLGAARLFALTGMPVHTVNTLPKMLWLQRHEPEIWMAAHRFLLYEDFVLQRLGGEPTISRCLASRTQMMDTTAGAWSDEILGTCGIEPHRLAPLAPEQGGVVGRIRPAVADALNLPRDLALVSGGHDQACAALGSGVVHPGQAMVSTGTAEVVEVAMADPTLDETLREGNISVYHHVVPGLYVAMTLNHSGGLLLRWFRDAFCEGLRDKAIARGEDPYDAILAGAPAGPTDLLVLPHWAGSGTPLFDTGSRGAILGLTFNTDRAVVSKAILEGLTFELRVNLDLLRQAGIEIEALHAVGGGARGEMWLRLKADICGTRIRVPRITEAACLGAALLAATAIGTYPDVATAAAQVVETEREIVPCSTSRAAYEARYALFGQVYPAISPIHHQMG